MDKQKILDKIMEEQEKIRKNMKSNVDRYKIASDLEENSASDPDELSHQTEAKDMQLRFEKLLRFSEQDLYYLKNLSADELSNVEKGSVIETENTYFFVGVSTANFKYEGKDVICFTEDAPIFDKIKNKKVGESFKMGAQDVKILSIN